MVSEELKVKMNRVERLVQSLETCSDPAVRDQARELIGALMEFHGAALTKIFDILAKSLSESSTTPNFSSLIRTIGRDPLAGSLLLLYGLHPVDFETRVLEALESVRIFLQSHRRDVELIKIHKKTVYLRLKGLGNGDSPSVTNFQDLIRRSIEEKAPEVEYIQVEP